MTKTNALRGVAISLLVGGFMTACAKPEAPKPDLTKAADAVKATAKDMVAAINAHDAAKAVSFDDASYVGMFHGTPNVNGPAEDEAMTKLQVADPTSHLEVSNETVTVAQAGDMAVYRATYVFKGTDTKTKALTTETGNWVVGFKPTADGSWKAAWGVVSDTPPAAPAAAPDKK